MQAEEAEDGKSSNPIQPVCKEYPDSHPPRRSGRLCELHVCLATSHNPLLLVHYPEKYLRGFGTLGKRLEDGRQNLEEHYAALECEGERILKA